MENENKGEDLFNELDSMFGSIDDNIKSQENLVLTQNLEGFASCFPEWDLHPPVTRKN